ncbi:MAG: ESX secretion-associated protein EspG [Mycobacterium sp.]|nr:ESX secretion-associated protein EspG [Mycobacterium sp.]
MLTTTLDGLWVLQVLSGIEVLAPELGLRPHLPSVENPTLALTHPVAEELRVAGVIDAHGGVDESVREWLTVLSRRDVAVLIHLQIPDRAEAAPEGVLLARFAQWWVCLERSGMQIRLSGAGTTSCEKSAGLLINSQIERICGQLPPAPLKPVTLDAAEMIARVGTPAGLRSFLRDQKVDAEQIGILGVAADGARSAQASVVAIQSGASAGPARSHVESGAVTIIDTPHGRLVSEHVRRGGKPWLIVGPGGPANIATAVLSMLRNLPAQQQWHSYRKAV